MSNDLSKEDFKKILDAELPPLTPKEEVLMWHSHYLKRMAINAGITEEELIKRLNDRIEDVSTVNQPADPTWFYLKNSKKENNDD